MTESGKEVTRANRNKASRRSYSLVYGENLERRAVVFKPFPGKYYVVSGCRTISMQKQTSLTAVAMIHPYIVSSMALSLMVCLMFFILDHRAKIDPQLIYPTWLAFTFALVVSAVVLIASAEAGIYDYDGNPRNELAKIILSNIDFFLDIGQETVLLGVCLEGVALPQWFAYLMSGLTGAAQEARFVKAAWRITALLLAK